MGTIVRTTAMDKILALNKRVRIIEGGAAASKTFSICMWIIDYAESTNDKVVSIVSESLPHLRKGAMRDFLNILKYTNRYSDKSYNKTDSTYLFSTGTIVEFFGVESSDKVRGPRRDVLFVNEANNIDYETYSQLELRTREVIFLDHNPVSAYYAHDKLMHLETSDFVRLTYRDNEALEPAIIRSIEDRRITNPNWYRVYGLGEVGHYEGQIYSNWQIIDDKPEEARLETIGLDFGYTNDPSAIVGIYKYNDGYILDEILYATSMSNANLAGVLANYPNILTIADSAEPKSIDEIQRLGIYIKGSDKGKGSVMQGIQLVQDQKLFVTKNSVNLIKELRGYNWKTDRAGKALNIPNHEFSHGMDAIRYALTDLISKPNYTSNSFVAL